MEQVIDVADLVKAILPQTTMDIISVQKNCRVRSLNQSTTKDMLEDFLILDAKGSISQLVNIGVINKNSELYKQKCADCTYYPFSIALQKGRIELIATSYETLKNWIIGINLLISRRDRQKLSGRRQRETRDSSGENRWAVSPRHCGVRKENN